MLIRPFEPPDAVLFRALRLRALADAPTSFGASLEEDAARPLDEVAALLLPTDDGFTLGAFDGEPVGMVGIRRADARKARHIAHLWGMYVAPGARGRGLARALVDAAVCRARELSQLEAIHLQVGTQNKAAVHIYERAGFVTWGVMPAAMRVGDVYVDEACMVLQLRN